MRPRAHLTAIHGSQRAAELFVPGLLQGELLLALQARSPAPILTYTLGALDLGVFVTSSPIQAVLSAERARALSEAPRQLRLAESSLEEGRFAGSTRLSDVRAVPRRESGES